jgi:hypothetical protein
MTFKRQPHSPASYSDPQGSRLLAVRAALRSLPVRANLHPMNPEPEGKEEVDRLRLLAFRGVLVAWTSVLYPGVAPDAFARAAAALDQLIPSLDSGPLGWRSAGTERW